MKFSIWVTLPGRKPKRILRIEVRRGRWAVITEAAFLKPSDIVPGYGTVVSVRPHHRASCPGECFGACTLGNPRTIVNFDGDASDYVFHAYTELHITRPEPECADLVSDDERW